VDRPLPKAAPGWAQEAFEENPLLARSMLAGLLLCSLVNLVGLCTCCVRCARWAVIILPAVAAADDSVYQPPGQTQFA